MATKKKAPQRPKKKIDPPVSSLSLADLEREGDDEKEPFTVDLPNGSTVTIGDPAELVWSDVVGLNPIEVFEEAMTEEDYYTLVVDGGLKGWQFGKIFDAWARYYGMGSQGE